MKKIEEIIELYVKGTKTGDVDLLKSIFHKHAIMSGDLGINKIVVGSPEIFFNDIKGEVSDEAYNYEIVNISKHQEIATASLKEYNLKGNDFVNIFQFQKINSEWKIISKLFTSLN